MKESEFVINKLKVEHKVRAKPKFRNACVRNHGNDHKVALLVIVK